MLTILAVTIAPASDPVRHDRRAHRPPAARATKPAPVQAARLELPTLPAVAAAPVPATAPQPSARPVPAATAAKSPASGSFVVRRILQIDKPLTYGDWYWDEAGAPQGRVVITVDLAAQVLSIFRAGYEIGTAVIIYGDERVPTPTGRFSILMKDAHHFSATYDHAPMPYTLRLTKDGVSIHGSEIADGNVTHGCIGLPLAFARKLFDAAHLGDLVIVTNGKMMKMGDTIVRS